MKRIFLIILLAFLAAGLASCGPKLRMRNDLGATPFQLGYAWMQVEVDGVEFDVTKLDPDPEAQTKYQYVTAGKKHFFKIQYRTYAADNTIIAWLYQQRDIEFDMQKGKKYVMSIGSQLIEEEQ